MSAVQPQDSPETICVTAPRLVRQYRELAADYGLEPAELAEYLMWRYFDVLRALLAVDRPRHRAQEGGEA